MKLRFKEEARDKNTRDIYQEGETYEFADKRGAEILAIENGRFATLVEEEKAEKFDREAAKARLKELAVEFSGNASNDVLATLLAEAEEKANTPPEPDTNTENTTNDEDDQ